MKCKNGQEKSGTKKRGEQRKKSKLKNVKMEDSGRSLLRRVENSRAMKEKMKGGWNKSTVGMELHEDYAGVMRGDHPPFCHSMMKRYGQSFKGNSRRGSWDQREGEHHFKNVGKKQPDEGGGAGWVKQEVPQGPYSFLSRPLAQRCHIGKILNDTFRVDSFASTRFSAKV